MLFKWLKEKLNITNKTVEVKYNIDMDSMTAHLLSGLWLYLRKNEGISFKLQDIAWTDEVTMGVERDEEDEQPTNTNVYKIIHTDGLGTVSIHRFFNFAVIKNVFATKFYILNKQSVLENGRFNNYLLRFRFSKHSIGIDIDKFPNHYSFFLFQNPRIFESTKTVTNYYDNNRMKVIRVYQNGINIETNTYLNDGDKHITHEINKFSTFYINDNKKSYSYFYSDMTDDFSIEFTVNKKNRMVDTNIDINEIKKQIKLVDNNK